MALSLNGRTSFFSQTLSHFRSRNTGTHQPEHTFVLNCSVQNTLTWSLGFFKLSSPLSYYTGKAGDHFQPAIFPSIPVFRVWTALNLWRASLITNVCSPSCPPRPFLLRPAHLCVCSWVMLELRGGQLWGSGSSWGSQGLEDSEHQLWSLCPTLGQCRWLEVVAEVKLGGTGHSLWEHSSPG